MSLARAAAMIAHAAGAPHPPEVRPPAAGPVALATGDSMMQVMERWLDVRLEGLGLPTVLDSRVGTGVSRPQLLDWVAYSQTQSADIRPAATIVFLGANDLLPIAGAPCCGPAWVAGYQRRARHMLQAWLRTGRVYWLSIPAPRDPPLARVHRAVNRAVRRAVAASGPNARVLDLVPVFTPGGRFRSSIVRDGHRVRVRMKDGVHLNAAGSRIATEVVVDALRADGLLASAQAARTCNLRGKERKLGATYVTTLSVTRVSCATGERVVRAFHRCRRTPRGRCHARVLRFRCRERRTSVIRTQFDSRVTCTRGTRRVRFTYSQFT